MNAPLTSVAHGRVQNLSLEAASLILFIPAIRHHLSSWQMNPLRGMMMHLLQTFALITMKLAFSAYSHLSSCWATDGHAVVMLL